MNLGVGEYKDGALAWLTAGREFGYRDIDFDPEFFGWMRDEITKFWIDYIVGNQEPPAYSAQDVLLKSPLHKAGKEIEATAEIGDMLIELKDIKEKSKTLENRQKEIEDNLKLFFGDAESIVDGNGKTLATWKAPKASEKFDAKAFQTDHPEECAAYIKQVQGARRLLIK